MFCVEGLKKESDWFAILTRVSIVAEPPTVRLFEWAIKLLDVYRIYGR